MESTLVFNALFAMTLHRSCLLLTVAAWTLVLGPSRGIAAGKVDFQKQIKPILAKHCTGCHGVK